VVESGQKWYEVVRIAATRVKVLFVHPSYFHMAPLGGFLGRLIVIDWIAGHVRGLYARPIHGGTADSSSGDDGGDVGSRFTDDDMVRLRAAAGSCDPIEFARLYRLRYPGESESRIRDEYEWWLEKG